MRPLEEYEYFESTASSFIYDIMDKMHELNKNGKLVYTVFNGTRYYSDCITEEGYYDQSLEKNKSKEGEIVMVTHEKIELEGGRGLSQVVEMLQNYKSKSGPVYVNFNDVNLYSDSVTMDSAYIQVTGKTKKEHDDFMKEQAEKAKKHIDNFDKAIPFLTHYYVQKGKRILDVARMPEWEEIVNKVLKEGIYQGFTLDCALEVLEVLEDGTSIGAKTTLDRQKDHSGGSYGETVGIIRKISYRGEEFVKLLE